MGVRVDRDPVRFAIPGPDRRLQKSDVVCHVNLLSHPIGHWRGKTPAEEIALPWCSSLYDIEIDGAAGNALLNAREDVGLRQVDPLDLRACIFLPCGEEWSEYQIVQA